jgi:hypothetical protein
MMEPSPKENQESEKEESSLRELGRPEFLSQCGQASNLGEGIEVYLEYTHLSASVRGQAVKARVEL